MYADAAAALRAAVEDEDVRVVIITGSGDSFCAGNDLKDFLENPPTTPDAPVFQFMQSFARCPKPVSAAVNGIAVGIGTTMLLYCDLVYAAVTGQGARIGTDIAGRNFRCRARLESWDY